MACEFFLIRYVPDVVKGEFVNIGVVLREAGGDPARAQVRFTRDWGRVRCMDVDADLGLLEGLEQEIGLRLAQGVSDRDPKRVLEVLEDSLSNAVQMTEPRACLAENLATELEQLMRMYVEPLKMLRTKGEGTGAKSGRGRILGSMRTEFERAGVWGAMQKRIAAATYTRAGDPMRIDCGYGVSAREPGERGTVRMFHAVSLDADVEAAKVLAFTAPMLHEGVGRVEAAELLLTAVVEPLRMVVDLEEASNGGNEAEERYRFGVETMERQQIRVVTLNDLARAAATAKRELRV
jgi:hypothetical protein